MAVLIGVGVFKSFHGGLAAGRLPRRPRRACRSARRATACSSARRSHVVLHAFASGGAAVTGVEAISNGVPAFTKPAWKNARDDARDHGLAARRDVPRPVGHGRAHARRAVHVSGTPTVISQIGKLAYGSSLARQHPLLLPAGRHDADPRARGQHELRRLPPPRVVPRRRQLHAPPAHQARPPARVLERHHLPGGRRRSCC